LKVNDLVDCKKKGPGVFLTRLKISDKIRCLGKVSHEEEGKYRPRKYAKCETDEIFRQSKRA